MTRSKPTITLIDYSLHTNRDLAGRQSYQKYKVDLLNGSIAYAIGKWLDSVEVQAIIDKGWNVNLRSPRKGEL